MPNGATALELARRTGIERPTVHRLLKTLAHWDMVHVLDGTYRVGPAALLLGTVHVDSLNVRRAALPYAVELQEKILRDHTAMVSISVPARDQVVIVERIWTPSTPMSVILAIGNHFAIDESASGRSILSTYDDDLCRATIGDARFAIAARALAAIRAAHGYSTTESRFTAGMTSLAYPILGRGGQAAGAMVIAGLDLEKKISETSPMARHLRRACETISAGLARG